MRKRIISLLIAACMVLTMVPVTASAQEGTESIVIGQSAGTPEKEELPVGASAPLECVCDTRCTEGAINSQCPVCSAEGVVLEEVCLGEPAPSTRWTYDPQAHTLTSDDHITLYNVTDDGSGNLTINGNREISLSTLDLTGGISDREGNRYVLTAIGYRAFQSSKLTSVVFPDTLTNIGGEAFQSSSLNSVNFPKSLRAIEMNAFGSCGLLTSVTIPSGVSLDSYIFTFCRNLSTVTVEEGVTSIPDGMFSNCGALKPSTGRKTIPSPKSEREPLREPL